MDVMQVIRQAAGAAEAILSAVPGGDDGVFLYFQKQRPERPGRQGDRMHYIQELKTNS
jgi:hypothetical protein